MWTTTSTVAALGLLTSVAAQPFQPDSGIAPLGSLRTSDYDGPYNITMLSAQANEAQAGAAARGYKGGITDKDIVDFLVNVECLEGLFDTWGVFGQGFIGDLTMGGPTPKGARQAELSEEVRTKLAEVALNEQGHALLTRHAGGQNPCPYMDFDKGFNDIMAAAFGLKGTVEEKYGAPFDPFKNDQNFIISMLTLEELGATGNKGLIGILTNPVLANSVAGLATSATAQAAIERNLLWDRRTATIEPFGESAQEVFARVSAYRDSMDGKQLHDQGIVNTDPRFIYVPFHGINLIPTDVHGITYNRSPMMNLNILTVGAKDGKGGFFPKGIHGKINTPEGYDATADGLADWPSCPPLAVQQSVEVTGEILPPIFGADDDTPVHGVHQLTQPVDGKRIGTGADGRGMQTAPAYNKEWQKTGDGDSIKPDIPANDGKLEQSRGYCGKCSCAAGDANCNAAEEVIDVIDE